jgi:hypothetical protein
MELDNFVRCPDAFCPLRHFVHKPDRHQYHHKMTGNELRGENLAIRLRHPDLTF